LDEAGAQHNHSMAQVDKINLKWTGVGISESFLSWSESNPSRFLMQQRLDFLTLGVKDFEKMKVFYQQTFGWTLFSNHENIAFFRLNGFIFSLYSEDALAEDIGIEQDGEGFKRMTLAINFALEAEVDAAFEELSTKGARPIKTPQKVFWGGYSGYVADLEGIDFMNKKLNGHNRAFFACLSFLF
jgi:uncharacterized protein